MIMPKGQQLLLPARPLFIAASLLAALAFNMLPLGRVVWTPDLLLSTWDLRPFTPDATFLVAILRPA